MIEWKDIAGYEGKYQVSSDGRVKRLEHDIYHPRGNGFIVHLKERLVRIEVHHRKTGIHPDCLVTLCKNGIQKKYLLHRIVANAFIPNPYSKPQVNHIDGNTLNNCVDNLEWVTGSENMQHAIRTGLYSAEQSKEAGMTHAKPVICLETGIKYRSQGEAARSNGVSLTVVQNSVKFNRPGRCGLTFKQI